MSITYCFLYKKDTDELIHITKIIANNECVNREMFDPTLKAFIPITSEQNDEYHIRYFAVYIVDFKNFIHRLMKSTNYTARLYQETLSPMILKELSNNESFLVEETLPNL